MIKSLKRNDIRSTPFVANKSWNSQNQIFDNTINWQSGSQSGSLFLTFFDYEDGTRMSQISSAFSSAIAYQQQDPDFLRFRIGQEITGTTFYPTSSRYYDSSTNPTNIDGTYQSLVYNTTKNLFYKETANPTQIFGLESLNPVDVNRTLPKQIYVFNVPQNKFGEKLVPNSIQIKQQLDDGNFVVIDDGNTNLKLSGSNFVDVQNPTYNCVSAVVNVTNTNQTYNGSSKSVTVTTNPSNLTTTTTYNGSETPPTNAGTYTIVSTISDGFYCGSTIATLVINKATATISVSTVTVTYDGSSHTATTTTTPTGLAYNIVYTDKNNNIVTTPIDVGTYTATATIVDENYQGTGKNTVTINPPTLTVNFPTITDQVYGTSQTINLNASSSPLSFPIQYSITSGTNLATIIDSNKIQINGQSPNHSIGSVTVKAETTNLPQGFTSANVTKTFNVTPKPIILDINQIKVSYDSGTNVKIDNTKLDISSQLVPGDNVTISGPSTGTIPSSTNGTYTVTPTSLYSLSGVDAGKYSLSQPSLTATVAPDTIVLVVKDFIYDGNPYTISDILSAGSTLGDATYNITFADNKNNILFTQTYNKNQPNTNVGPTDVANYTLTITNSEVPTDTKTVTMVIKQANAIVLFDNVSQGGFKYIKSDSNYLSTIQNDKIQPVTINQIYYIDRNGKTITISVPTTISVTYNESTTLPTTNGTYTLKVSGSDPNLNFTVSGVPTLVINDFIYIVYALQYDLGVILQGPTGADPSQYTTSSNYNLLKLYNPSAVDTNWSTHCNNNTQLINYKLTDYTGNDEIGKLLDIWFTCIGAGGGGSGFNGNTNKSYGGGGGAYIGFVMPAKYVVDNNINSIKMVTYGIGQSGTMASSKASIPTYTATAGTEGGPAFFVTGNSYTKNDAWLGIYAEGGGGATGDTTELEENWNQPKLVTKFKIIQTGNVGTGGKSYINQKSYTGILYTDNSDYTNAIGGVTTLNTQIIDIKYQKGQWLEEYNTAQNGFDGNDNNGGSNGVARVNSLSTSTIFGKGVVGFGADYNNYSLCQIAPQIGIYKIYLNANKIYDINNF